MQIEVAITHTEPQLRRGELLEELAAELLIAQFYDVERNVRKTANELDLLCRHKGNNRQIYVECKAHRSPLKADVLTKLFGVVGMYGYAEGWLISTGPLTRDARGLQEEWNNKPQAEREKLSIYTPERVIEALTRAGIVTHPPQSSIHPNGDKETRLGDWTLMVTEFGRYWVQTILVSGVPEAVQVFSAEEGKPVNDLALLSRLSGTDSSLHYLDFEYRVQRAQFEHGQIREYRQQPVVQVQEGVSWDDYRPSRPVDFVGRRSAQGSIMKLLEAVRTGKTSTRVFAVTGDSGMGKSSLIAKLRAHTRNTYNRNKFLIYAVDVRAATKPTYILSSLLACIRSACDSGFIALDEGKLEVSNYSQPLSSSSIQSVLESLREQERVICLVFDQFEELYSKPKMFSIFNEVKRLLLSTASIEENLVLGFAWRTDCMVPQDHPAYQLWHELRDYRYEVSIGPLGHSEVAQVIKIFENEIARKLQPTTRRQVIENSRGFPWLLKKLCIHIYRTLTNGGDGANVVESLDIRRLFDDDMKALTGRDLNNLKFIARHTPVEIHEVVEVVGAEAFKGLQDRRLIVQSGDHINLYWDLFREYILTGQVPSIPFTYISSYSIRTFLDVAEQLSHETSKSFQDLSKLTDLSPNTVQNIVRDLIMYSVAKTAEDGTVLHPDIASATRKIVLDRVRSVLKHHALYLDLSSHNGGNVFVIDDLIGILKRSNPTAQYRMRTWNVYAKTMGQWLCAAGYLELGLGGWIVHDIGGPAPLYAMHDGRDSYRRLRRKEFQGQAPPEAVIACLDWLSSAPERTVTDAREAKLRNALAVLVRFALVRPDGSQGSSIRRIHTAEESRSLVWSAAWKDPTLVQICGWLHENPSLSGPEIGRRLATDRRELWTDASAVRIGNGLRRWAGWMVKGDEHGPPPAIPQRWRLGGQGSERHPARDG